MTAPTDVPDGGYAPLRQLPPPLVLPGARNRIRQSFVESGTKIAVIDDDPTGTQVVAGLPVITSWTDENVDWALAEAETAFVVLTNSRSLDAADAVKLNLEVGERLARRGRAHGIDVRCISRSDSTLRGHFPDEVDALIEGLSRGGQQLEGILLAPAFFDAGRMTVDDVHYVMSSDRLVPVAETEFARDATFGFTSSNLRAWAQERGVNPATISSLDLATIRTGGPDAVAGRLMRRSSDVIVVNAVEEADLDVVTLGLLAAEQRGLRLVYRTAPSFVGARLGQQLTPPLTTAQIRPRQGPGLLVVGSHTAVTTRQLEHVRRVHDIPTVELRVDRLDGTRREIEACSAALRSLLQRGDAALVTSRMVRRSVVAGRDLEIARLVADAIVEVVRSLPAEQPLGWIVAKGGITSSDVATRGLGVSRAHVLGQVFPGLVSVWRLAESSRRSEIPYVVFPGNVGADDALSITLERMKGE
ncbi:four-carbon acid sugar kinase family protein [Conexibacter stalactiti]|uniref:Four-carbon acid sugar kinase family protein n=1 Tax=Conexibacter stalactiti TaxID=1940611 RepID=A0ABU4HK39_9ACTN|nr:four-carbon acid sugar kinase family protein [Conexibacter stalactiti]MDW5593069.1 four-carbon acid sugar kinase family protein [Conexibacter stalactiti]MEC5033710.1 four-carbon acid sugar kinase family protein [Conexibacter stalactiti]